MVKLHPIKHVSSTTTRLYEMWLELSELNAIRACFNFATSSKCPKVTLLKLFRENQPESFKFGRALGLCWASRPRLAYPSHEKGAIRNAKWTAFKGGGNFHLEL